MTELVIFDCDGVLVDSEAIVADIVAASLTALGWPMSGPDSQARFIGMTLTDMIPAVEARVGALPAGWMDALTAAIVARLAEGVPPVRGAADALRAVSAMGLPWRVASNSSRAEMAVKFQRTGLDAIIAPDRIHSAADVIALGGRGKPAPDVFLAAARAEGIDPARCVVIEDSAPGARGAKAAGMTCLGYAPHGSGDHLTAHGARVMRDLAELPGLLQALSRGEAA